MTSSSFSVIDGRKVFMEQALATRRPNLIQILKPATKADVTVIIPTMERPEIAACIQALTASLRADGLTAHLVVVDQSITQQGYDQTLAETTAAAKFGVFASVMYYHDISLTISTAKNKGVALLYEHTDKSLLGELFVFIDSDIYVTASGIAALIEAEHTHPEVAVFSLPSLWLRSTSQLDWLSSPPNFTDIQPDHVCKPEPSLLETAHPVGSAYSAQSNAGGRLARVPVIHGCIFAIRASVFAAVGGFNDFFGMHGEHVELCARLNDNRHAMAYIMDQVVLHDDRSVQQSVMRNMPDREQYLLATLITMCARNRVTLSSKKETAFIGLIESKWLPNLAVAPDQIPAALRLILELGTLLRTHKAQPAVMLPEAWAVIARSGLSSNSTGHFQQALDYIWRNNQALPLILEDIEHQTLYNIPSNV